MIAFCDCICDDEEDEEDVDGCFGCCFLQGNFINTVLVVVVFMELFWSWGSLGNLIWFRAVGSCGGSE